MRFAVISDVHGNLPALQAVLDAIDRDGPEVDRIICAGDLVGWGPDPNEVLELIQEREIEAVLGNYDDAVANRRLSSGIDFVDARAEQVDDRAVAWTREKLTSKNHEYLRSLPRDLRLFPTGSGVVVQRDEIKTRARAEGRSMMGRVLFGGLLTARPRRVKTVLVVHGSPRALNERITSEIANSILRSIERDAKADVLVTAHAAEPFQRDSDQMTLVGVGAASGTAAYLGRSHYAVVEVGNGVRADYKTAAYDAGEFLERMRRRGMPSEVVDHFTS